MGNAAVKPGIVVSCVSGPQEINPPTGSTKAVTSAAAHHQFGK